MKEAIRCECNVPVGWSVLVDELLSQLSLSCCVLWYLPHALGRVHIPGKALLWLKCDCSHSSSLLKRAQARWNWYHKLNVVHRIKSVLIEFGVFVEGGKQIKTVVGGNCIVAQLTRKMSLRGKTMMASHHRQHPGIPLTVKSANWKVHEIDLPFTLSVRSD